MNDEPRQHTTTKILVFEPHANGHHGPYLQWMTRGLVERGLRITVVTLPEPAKLADLPSRRDARYRLGGPPQPERVLGYGGISAQGWQTQWLVARNVKPEDPAASAWPLALRSKASQHSPLPWLGSDERPAVLLH